MAEEIKPEAPPTEPNPDEVQKILDEISSPVDLGDEVGVRADSVLGVMNSYVEALPRSIDDLDERLGTEVKEKMMLDAIIHSTIHWLVAAALDRDITFNPVIRDKENPNFKDSQYTHEHLMNVMEPWKDEMKSDLHDMAVNALVRGSCIGELVAPLQEKGPDAGKRYVVAVKPRHPDVVSFVVDPHMNVLGIAAQTVRLENKEANVDAPSVRKDGKPTDLLFSSGRTLPEDWKVFSPKKFVWMTNKAPYGDPRGQSALRHIYNEFYLIQAIWPHYLKYLMKFASPTVDFEMEEGVVPTTKNPDPLKTATARLKQFGNSSYFARHHGSKLNLLYSQGQGEAFTMAIGLLERRIVRGLTNQLLANNDSRNGSRAQAQTHQDTQNIVVRIIKSMVSHLIREQVLKVMVEVNLGPEFVRFASIPSLGNVAPEDLASIRTANSAMWRDGYLHPSQLRDLDAEAGLPYREVAEPGFYPSSAVTQETFENPPEPVAPAPRPPAAGTG